jgi:gluconolactonase
MAEVELLADGLGSPEGPDFLPDGRAIFVETFLCRVSAWDPRTGVHAYADVGGAPTACVRGLDGVYVAQNGRTAGPWRSPRPCAPSIQRIAGDGRVEIVADSASGVPCSVRTTSRSLRTGACGSPIPRPDPLRVG